ncbi:MAG: signal recognition particle-docking protein FtsY [Clostridia bacterium]|nr:signal recognition particle-docking protein FtsY [Clostridia bacterium]
MALFKKINFGLSKTRNKMSGAIDDMLDAFDSFEEDLYTELEEILVMGDVGVTTAVQVVEELKSRVKSEKIKRTDEVKKELENIIADLLYGGEDMGLVTIPSVILVIGVNGAGKTTTIGKMAAMYKSQGKKVILGAADTFRAAAIDQLDVWANRAGVDIVKHKEGADPAAVIYDTIQAGIARDCDIIICDTAGRLHNKKNLMDELAKIYRVMDKELPYADREVLLVLDATTGQNAVNQAKEFMGVAELTGIVLTKLDGTARGGVVLSIKNDLKLPVKFIGVGEGLDDLQPFDPAAFAKSLFVESNEKEDEENENTLTTLVNSEEYINYKPQEDTENGIQAVQEILGEILESIAEDGNSESEVEREPQQTSGSAYEVREEGAEEAEQENAQSTQENTLEAAYENESVQADDQKEEELHIKAEAERLEAERIAREKAEAERLEAERIAREKAEAERLEAERIAREKAETERLEAERIAREKAEAERLEAERIAREKAEAERLEAERIAKEKAEKERLEAEKAQAEEPKKKERRGFFGLFNRNS